MVVFAALEAGFPIVWVAVCLVIITTVPLRALVSTAHIVEQGHLHVRRKMPASVVWIMRRLLAFP